MKAITANRLTDGRVIYLGSDDQWVDQLADARLVDGSTAEQVLAEAMTQATFIADAYIISATDEGAPAGREAIKEAIRNSGPTVRVDLGKQAGNS